MKSYDHKKIEKKWQKKWEEGGLYHAGEDSRKPKQYVLGMFPYPSGDGLHVGHVLGYTATDIYSRYKRMGGFDVLQPMGWDAFGLPAENYAIKTGTHPRETTDTAINNFRKQIKSLGLSYDWTREIGTHTPEYYKWTQWFFLLLYKNNLAYKARAHVNWCDSCKTVLANEQVENGLCERCKNQVIQKDLEQWFFKITDFTEDLINGLDTVNWPQSTIINQRNWIGKSEGSEIGFKIKDTKHTIQVFTTRADTLFGATYLVLAPEHEEITHFKEQITNWEEVEKYIEDVKKKTELERMAEGKDLPTGKAGKTGVPLKGIKAINPANSEEVPIFIADYVLAHYGTGAIMAVPAHDERDFEFAKKFNITVKEVIQGGDLSKGAYMGSGTLINSGTFNGVGSVDAKKAITEFVGGKMKTTYKLRDWLISRQRYWGAPIPVVYDPQGTPHGIPEEHLPWQLPTDVEFKPTGVSPLSQSKELKDRTEKIFGKGWTPEVDTMDTFVCSSWYYFRFADPHNSNAFASKEALKRFLPVDMYVGGAEHTVLHLLYARFFTKVLHKLGYISFTEPFATLRHQGMILATDGRKMSKSFGNVVNPDDVVETFGADSVRMYEMFMGSLEDAKPWKTDNIIGIRRFLEKVWRLQLKVKEEASKTEESTVEATLHKTIKKVSDDIETFGFNTAISQMMICVNTFEKQGTIDRENFKILLKLLAPFAPHITEELWEMLEHTGSIHLEEWPIYDKKKIRDETFVIAVQINGKVRDTFEISADLDEEQVKVRALSLESVRTWTENKEIKKFIYVKNKLVSIVV